MCTIYDIPEHLLHDILLLAIDSTRYICWRLSLRLVNHAFNEAILQCYYLRRHRLRDIGHSPDCVPIWRKACLCFNSIDRQTQSAYMWRFMFQKLLANSGSFEADAPYPQLLLQWKTTLTILRGLESFRRLDADRTLSYSTCSSNAIFNDAQSAVLAKVVAPRFLDILHEVATTCPREDQRDSTWTHFKGLSTELWIALCACVLDDSQLFEAQSKNAAQLIEWPWKLQYSHPNSVNQHSIFLTETVDKQSVFLMTAIEHGSFGLVQRILKDFPPVMFEQSSTKEILKAAIFCKNNEILKEVLQHMPARNDMLEYAIEHLGTLLTPCDRSSETVRLLTQHFVPLSPEARARLIIQSCAIGDVALLENFSRTDRLFSHRIENNGGTLPSYLDCAILYGNHGVVRFLLDNEIQECRGELRLKTLKQTLMFNQTDCFREIHSRIWGPVASYQDIGLADNMEDILAEHLTRERLAGATWPILTLNAPYALWHAIQRLRVSNVRFLLKEGIQFRPWDPQGRYTPHYAFKDPLEIPWPYFSKNRDAFQRTQEVLDAFGLPKLRVVV